MIHFLPFLLLPIFDSFTSFLFIEIEKKNSLQLSVHKLPHMNTHIHIRLYVIEKVMQVPTALDKRNLYFNVITNREGNQTVTVEGAGVNATLIQADIAQTNGFVHIIDRVLGIPFGTVYDKIRTDPMLK